MRTVYISTGDSNPSNIVSGLLVILSLGGGGGYMSVPSKMPYDCTK